MVKAMVHQTYIVTQYRGWRSINILLAVFTI